MSKTKKIAKTTIDPVSVPCKKCGALPGKKCRNTETNAQRKNPHNVRIETAKAWKGKKPQVESQPVKDDKKKKWQPTPEQAKVIDKVTKKIEMLTGYAPEFLPPVTVGPLLSVYKFLPSPKIRVSVLEKMHEDLALALGLDTENDNVSIRRMSGETAMGVYVPHPKDVRKPVLYTDTVNDIWNMVQDQPMAKMNKYGDAVGMPIPLNFGMDYLGNKYIENLINCPHLLIAGSTGGGKSILLKSIAASLVYCIPPSRLKLAISDTKEVEFKLFDNAPHLTFPRAKSIYETMQIMEALINESESRQKILAQAGCENVHQYNVQHPDRIMPYIVFIIDELADVILHAGEKRGEAKVAEAKLGKIVSKARFTGIYSIAGTQRPSHDVIKGSVKANYTCRLCFRLPSALDSRIALTQRGAEQLLSKGDMLYYSGNRPGLLRLHAPFVSREDIKAAVEAAVMMHTTAPAPEKQEQYSAVVARKVQ